MSADILAILLRVTLAASAGIVLVLLMRKAARRAFGAQIAYALWLLVPIATLAAFLPARTVLAEAPALSVGDDVDTETWTDRSTETAEGGFSYAQVSPADWGNLDLAPLLFFIWLTGALFSILLLLRNHNRFMRNIDAAGPAVVGVLRPFIVLPRDFEQRYTAHERELVLAHERAHLAGFDAQINALVAFAHCLNWFNPLFPIARKALRIDQELACDARVITRHADARRVYAEAMLKTQLCAQPVPLGCQWPPIGPRPLKERITMLSRPLPSAARATFGAMLCAAATFAIAGAVWIAQPPRVAYASEEQTSVGSRALGRQLVAMLQENQTDEARELIGAGADVNTFIRGDGTPLVIASRNGDRAMVEYLLARGADVNQAAPGDGNALIMASASGHIDIVNLLIQRGADVNGIVHGDETPLINAARENRLDVARILIENGADVNLAVRAPTMDGSEMRSPLSMARRGGHDEMIRLLREHGATG